MPAVFELPGLPGLPGTSRKRKAADKELFTPADEESLARKAGKIALGGLSAVGNLLDLPGSMVRDVVGGKNPLDQILSPFSPDNRTTSGDLLRKTGMISKDSWSNLPARLAADIVMDPLTYLLPFGAATKAGKLLKSADLAGEIPIAAAAKLGKSVGEIGPRQAAMTATMRDVVKTATPKQMASLQTAATKAGVNLANEMDKPLRGMFGYGFFGKPIKVMGTGAKAKKYATAVDTVGGTIRYGKVPGTEFSPVDEVAKLFNAKLGAVTGKVGQVFAKRAFHQKELGLQQAKLITADYVGKLVKAGFATEEKADLLTSALEEIAPGTFFHQLPPEVQQIVTDLEKSKNAIRDSVIAEGGKIEEYVSPLVKHWPRYGLMEEVTTPRSGLAVGAPFDMRNPSEYQRSPIFSPYTDKAGTKYGIADETTTLRNLSKDTEINEAIEAFKSPDDIAKLIEQKYGNKIYRWYQEVPGDGNPKNRYLALAEWMSNLHPEQRKAGFFANNPVLDFHNYAARGIGKAGALRSLRDYILHKNVLWNPGTAANQRGWKTLKEALTGVNGQLDPLTFGKKLLDDELAGLNPQQLMDYKNAAAADLKRNAANLSDDEMLQHFLSRRVSDETAENISRIANGFSSPEPARKILKFLDSYTNLWKGHMTGIWPAFHTRNLISSQVNAYLSGHWDPHSFKSMWGLLRGKAIDDAASYPIVQQIARERGITNLTNEQATDILGQVLYAHGTTSRFAGEQMSQAGMAGVRSPQTIEDTVREIPRTGFNGVNIPQIARKFVGMEPGTSWNPLKMRGVSDTTGQVRTQSQFGMAAAGEQVNPIVEGMARGVGMLYQLKRGIDPAEAAANVGRAQALYDARYFTPFEREVMQRLMPFYKFTKAMPIWMWTELTERPSGRLAQLIRGVNKARDPSAMTPDYVAETASIPLGTSKEGFDRYLTGGGLMMEDPLSFLGGGARGALLEAGSRMNPLVKAPLEWMTNQSFFQKGPMGGRNLEDLDPTIGRTLANLTGQKKAVTWPGSQVVENIIGNSPLSRAASSLRTLSYPVGKATDKNLRSEVPGEVLRTATNLGTGFRVTNVSPGAKDAMLRERANILMRRLGSKTFSKTYIPKEVEAEMTPRELEEARKLEALMHVLSMRAKERKEARK